MSSDEEVFQGLLKIQAIVESPVFNKWRAAFVDKHCISFSFEDENKLEYTELHDDYAEGIEDLLEENLPKEFSMESFMGALPAYLEGPGKEKEETGRAVTLLLGISDFPQFKDMMLYEKQQREEAASAPSVPPLLSAKAEVIQVEELLDLCAKLSIQDGTPDGWQTILNKPDMKCEQKLVEEEKRSSKSECYMRFAMTTGVNYKECLDMFLYYGERRKMWDTNYQSHTVLNGGDLYADEEVLLEVNVNYGTLVHMMGLPKSMTIKVIKKHDFPKPGMLTFASMGWDVTNNCPDTKSKLAALKTGTISPHPTDPSKGVMHSLSLSNTGAIPKWGLSLLMSTFAPQMLKGMEGRYIQHIRKKNLTVDLTPEGLKRRPPGQMEPVLVEK